LLQVNTKYTCKYRDGTIVEDLTFDESYSLFTKALATDNPCSVYPKLDNSK